MKRMNAITDVRGIEVGHAQDEEALTGCTVILCRRGAVAGVDVRGGAPGTRETDLLDPVNLVQKVHAIVLAGGSAYGLDAASGVMRYLEEQNIGYETGVVRVPIVPSAILFDLALGDSTVRPTPEFGYRAAASANAGAVPEGNVGAGTGATAGKAFGIANATKTGIGSASLDAGGGIIVGALAAVNPFGDVIDPQTGKIIAGTRMPGTNDFADTLEILKTFASQKAQNFSNSNNTVIAVVATNAKFDKSGMTKIAQMSHDGLARAIRPAHTLFDGDTIFALSTGEINADVSIVGAFAAEAVTQAILRAVKMSASAGGLPGFVP